LKAIATALLSVQQNLDPVHKGRKGYGYNYADLPAVMDSCMDALNAAGILVVQSPALSEKQAAAIHTRLIHAGTGEELTSNIEVPWAIGGTKMSEAQAFGSAMTYARRYALVSMLGIVTEDDDGASAGRKADKSPPAKAPVKSEAEKVNAAIAFAESCVKVYQNMIEPEDKNGYLSANWPKIEACMKYPAAAKLLLDAGLVQEGDGNV
jgi:hypothetical protein